MASPAEELLGAIEESGVNRSEATHAVRMCMLAMALHGVVTTTGGGLLLYFLEMNPAAGLSYGMLAFGAGATHALIKSPACSEVRTAVQFWNRTPF